MTTREINIPFGGFYASKWSDLLDREIEQTAEWDHEKQSEQGEHYQPEELRLTEDFFHEALSDACSYRTGYEAIARDYVDLLNRLLDEELGLKLGLSFKIMESPRFYNFATDRLFSDISLKSARRLFAYSRKLDKHATLEQAIKERHTSYDGFHSHYSNVLSEWLEKPIEQWDHNELATLLCVALVQLRDHEEQQWDWRIYEALGESCNDYVDAALDWAKYTQITKEKREELRAALVEEEPEDEPHYRCAFTLDLFQPRV